MLNNVNKVGSAGTQIVDELTSQEATSNADSGTLMITKSTGALAVELGGDVNAQLAAMMLKHGHERRAHARNMRHVQEGQIREFEAEQVKKMHEEADRAYAAAVTKAVGQIAGGGLQMGGGAAKMQGNDGLAGGLEGGGKGLSGSAELLAAPLDDAAKRAQIAGTEAEHKANEAKRRLDDLKDDEQGARELIRNTFDFLKGARDGEASVNRACLLNRA